MEKTGVSRFLNDDGIEHHSSKIDLVIVLAGVLASIYSSVGYVGIIFGVIGLSLALRNWSTKNPALCTGAFLSSSSVFFAGLRIIPLSNSLIVILCIVYFLILAVLLQKVIAFKRFLLSGMFELSESIPELQKMGAEISTPICILLCVFTALC